MIPISWSYAITRYRLMDVDIIFQQGYVYTLATLAGDRHFLRADLLSSAT